MHKETLLVLLFLALLTLQQIPPQIQQQSFFPPGGTPQVQELQSIPPGVSQEQLPSEGQLESEFASREARNPNRLLEPPSARRRYTRWC